MSEHQPEFEPRLRSTLRDAAATTRADDDLVDRVLVRARAGGDGLAPAPAPSRGRWLAPALAAASVAVVAGGIVAFVASSSDTSHPRPAGQPTATSGLPGTPDGTSGGGEQALPNAVGDCRFAAFEPLRIRLSCRNLRSSVEINDWTTWTGTRASGTGDVVRSDCKPTCGTGHLSRYPARIVLSQPVQAPGGTQFTRLTLIYSGPSPDGTTTQTVILPTV